MNDERQEMMAGTEVSYVCQGPKPKPRALLSRESSKPSRKSREGRLEDLAETLVSVLEDHSGQGLTLGKLLAALERDVLVKTLRRYNGHQHKASLFLGLKPTTLCVKLQKYGVVIRRTEVDIQYPATSFLYAGEAGGWNGR